MPIIFQKNEPENGSGVIVYNWNRTQGTLDGTFVLELYGGKLAKETGKKICGPPGALAGEYAITTFTPTCDVFSTGKLIIAPLGNEGAYEITYILSPTRENLAGLGYIEGTSTNFKGVGFKLPDQDLFAVSWDNNAYTRVWSAHGSESEEWGFRYITNSQVL